MHCDPSLNLQQHVSFLASELAQGTCCVNLMLWGCVCLWADIKTTNQKHRDEPLNRRLQNFLYSMLADEHEGAAKKSLAVLTELHRRHVWRDARSVNVIGTT